MKQKKYSRKILIDTLKLLLARSGNQCAFPGCLHPLFDDKNLFIAQLCHIEAVSPNGQRHNPNRTYEEINSYNNLIFLCYRHHKETDNVELYPVQKLKEIKDIHEAKFKEVSFKYSQEVLDKLEWEINNFWTHVDKSHSEHIAPSLAVPINSTSNIVTLIEEINENLNNLSEINSVLMTECKSIHFEYVCIAIPNMLTRIGVALDQLEIKYTEEQILKKPNDKDLKEKLNSLRNNFEKLAKSAGLD